VTRNIKRPRVDLPGPALSLAAGTTHTCAIVGDGGLLKCWGANSYGELGAGSLHDLGDSADEMGEMLAPVDIGGRRAIAIALGRDHTCVINDAAAGQVWEFSKEFPLRLAFFLPVNQKKMYFGKVLTQDGPHKADRPQVYWWQGSPKAAGYQGC